MLTSVRIESIMGVKTHRARTFVIFEAPIDGTEDTLLSLTRQTRALGLELKFQFRLRHGRLQVKRRRPASYDWYLINPKKALPLEGRPRVF